MRSQSNASVNHDEASLHVSEEEMSTEQLLKELAHVHGTAVRFARSVLSDLNRHLAEDIVQDAAEIVVRKIMTGEYEPNRAKVLTFLKGVINTKTLECYGRAKRRLVEVLDRELPDGRPGPNARVEHIDLMAKLRNRFEALPKEQQAALNRHFGANLFGIELPESLNEGVKLNTLYGRKFRAIETLRDDFLQERV